MKMARAGRMLEPRGDTAAHDQNARKKTGANAGWLKLGFLVRCLRRAAAASHKTNCAQTGQHQGVGLWLWYCCYFKRIAS